MGDGERARGRAGCLPKYAKWLAFLAGEMDLTGRGPDGKRDLTAIASTPHGERVYTEVSRRTTTTPASQVQRHVEVWAAGSKEGWTLSKPGIEVKSKVTHESDGAAKNGWWYSSWFAHQCPYPTTGAMQSPTMHKRGFFGGAHHYEHTPSYVPDYLNGAKKWWKRCKADAAVAACGRVTASSVQEPPDYAVRGGLREGKEEEDSGGHHLVDEADSAHQTTNPASCMVLYSAAGDGGDDDGALQVNAARARCKVATPIEYNISIWSPKEGKDKVMQNTSGFIFVCPYKGTDLAVEQRLAHDYARDFVKEAERDRKLKRIYNFGRAAIGIGLHSCGALYRRYRHFA